MATIRITDTQIAQSNNRDHGKMLRVRGKRVRDEKLSAAQTRTAILVGGK